MNEKKLKKIIHIEFLKMLLLVLILSIFIICFIWPMFQLSIYFLYQLFFI
jgi:hypothetical protein